MFILFLLGRIHTDPRHLDEFYSLAIGRTHLLQSMNTHHGVLWRWLLSEKIWNKLSKGDLLYMDKLYIWSVTCVWFQTPFEKLDEKYLLRLVISQNFAVQGVFSKKLIYFSCNNFCTLFALIFFNEFVFYDLHCIWFALLCHLVFSVEKSMWVIFLP